MHSQPTGYDYAHEEEWVVPGSGLKSVERSYERRKTPRICVPFHATLRGVDDEGENFTVDTVLDNVSSDGLYMRIMPRVKIGTSLAIEIALHKPLQATEQGSRLLVDGVVLRTEDKAGGASGVAVTFERVRFA
jgi:hypothetical protein